MKIYEIISLSLVLTSLSSEAMFAGCPESFHESATPPSEIDPLSKNIDLRSEKLRSAEAALATKKSELRSLKSSMEIKQEGGILDRIYKLFTPTKPKITADQEKQVVTLEGRIKELEKIVESLQNKDRHVLLRELKKKWTQAEVKPIIQDFIRYGSIERMNGKSMVTFLVSEATETNIQSIKAIVAPLAERGYTIVYDADAPAAPVISQVAGPQGLGIASRESFLFENSGAVILIEDPYFRLESFSKSHYVLGTPDSLPALALAMEKKLSLGLGVGAHLPKISLKSWSVGLDARGQNLGLHYPPLPISRNHEDVIHGKNPKGELLLPVVKEKHRTSFKLASLDELSYKGVFSLTHYVKNMALKRQKPFTDAITVLGSGEIIFLPDSARQDLYQAIYQLSSQGETIVSGGAEGIMKIANMAAFDGGGESIGVPIVGVHRLKSEHVVPTEIHSLTIPVPDYISRLPLLLSHKKALIFAQGRSGTMRELAVAFLQLVSDPERSPMIILYDNPYKFSTRKGHYTELANIIDQLPLDVRFKKKILTTTSNESLWKALGLNPQGIRTKQPRNERQSYPADENFSDVKAQMGEELWWK